MVQSVLDNVNKGDMAGNFGVPQLPPVASSAFTQVRVLVNSQRSGINPNSTRHNYCPHSHPSLSHSPTRLLNFKGVTYHTHIVYATSTSRCAFTTARTPPRCKSLSDLLVLYQCNIPNLSRKLPTDNGFAQPAGLRNMGQWEKACV